MHPPQNQSQQPQYQSKSNKKLFAIIGAVLVVIAIAVVVVVFVFLQDTVHRRVVFSSEDFFEKTAIDYDARIMYFLEDGVESIVKLNDDMFFAKGADEDDCVSGESEFLMGVTDMFLTVFLPPEDAEKDGSKTVNDVKCDIYKATVTFEGESADLQWCVADGFVIEIDDGTEEDPAILTGHKKLDEDSKYFDENKLCDSIEPVEPESSVKASSLPKMLSIGTRFLKKKN
ncbi:hypothetical protein GEMRC1_009734 [Eukaryota sp. GEM-RC1]